ncbi:hypothetical protein D9M69_461960 [compost metagenome]
MRGVSLEARITGNRIEATRQQQSADAALREGEYRVLYTKCKYRSHFEAKSTNCALSNTLQAGGERKPCLLEVNEQKLTDFVRQPNLLHEDTDSKTTYLTSASTSGLAWMPYTGLDPNNPTTASHAASWNIIQGYDGSKQNESINPEYGNMAEGVGIFYYVVNGAAGDVSTQSVASKIFADRNFCD